MTKYHVNPETGRVGVCTAEIQCLFKIPEEDHFSSVSDAMKWYEKKNESLEIPRVKRVPKEKYADILLEKMDTPESLKIRRILNKSNKNLDSVIAATRILAVQAKDDKTRNEYTNIIKVLTEIPKSTSLPDKAVISKPALALESLKWMKTPVSEKAARSIKNSNNVWYGWSSAVNSWKNAKSQQEVEEALQVKDFFEKSFPEICYSLKDYNER